jgi:hypothetical protein
VIANAAAIARIRPMGLARGSRPWKGDGSLAGAKAIFARAFAGRCGAYLALAALIPQLALSFAHAHKHHLVSSGFDRSGVMSAGLARPTQQAVTQQPSRLADDDDHCPICFSGFLLSNSSLPSAPVTLRSLHDQVFRPRHVAFLSRAPTVA